jgi:hypothetical protein
LSCGAPRNVEPGICPAPLSRRGRAAPSSVEPGRAVVLVALETLAESEGFHPATGFANR